MELDDAAACLDALGQPTRLALLRALLAAGPSGVAAGDLAQALGVPASTLSFHLRALEATGLVAATRQGRSLVYAARIDRLRGVLAFLVEACCGGDPARCGDLARLPPLPGDAAVTPPPFDVLFLCTRNSARSIMAEAILAKLGAGRFRAHSAGSEPAPEGPMPEVLSHLKAMGHDVAGLRSKGWDSFAAPGAARMDFVIALCDTLDGQDCPDVGDAPVTAAWPLPDPAKFTGSAAERATLLNELYAALHRRLSVFAALPVAALGRVALQARVDALASPHPGTAPATGS